MNIMREKIGNFSREIKTIETNQIKIWKSQYLK